MIADLLVFYREQLGEYSNEVLRRDTTVLKCVLAPCN